ncbi:hypothetical protein BHM03_00005135, partial [Ensete ventricosum]
RDIWNDVISFLPLQEFIFLTFVQKKLCAFAPCFIFYVNSDHVAWALHKVSPKLLHFSICIELNSISTSTLSVASFDVVLCRSTT